MEQQSQGEEEPRPELRQWHPVLMDGLRYLFGLSGAGVRIDEEVAIAPLPTRVDTVAARRDPEEELPFPYNHLGTTTLIELDTPGEYLSWQTARKLLGKWAYYSVKEGRRDMGGVSLWLLASRVSRAMLAWVARQHGGVAEVGSGVWRANCHDSPLFVIHQHALPLSVETLPLLMAYKGPREREIAEFALQHGRQYPLFLEQIVRYHAVAVKEVLVTHTYRPEMRELMDMDAIVDVLAMIFGKRSLIEKIGEDEFINEIGEEKIIRDIGEEKIIRDIGEEKIIRDIGEERVLKNLVNQMGVDRFRALMEKTAREHEGNGGA